MSGIGIVDDKRKMMLLLKPGFHMIVTVGDASPRQARGHMGDGCVKWEHFLNDVADQTETVRGRSKRFDSFLKKIRLCT